jgi:dihydrodipicolinate synthase/N-acetylneuraminate lyase
VLRGAIAAAVTPLTDGGARVDEDAIGPLVRFLADGGLDGVFVCGTTGEGILLGLDERRRVAERVVAERPDGFQVAIHAGAQTTADTAALAAHARDAGADAVAVIAPPYFPLDEEQTLAHLAEAASACAPLPFYVYEFAQRSGYAIPVRAIERLRDLAPNLAGMKVSDSPWEAVEPYLLPGLVLFVGSEPLVLHGLRRGAVGAVSALASAFPDVVAELVHDRSERAGERVAALRDAFGPHTLIAALKEVLGARGLPVGPDVRAPLRRLTDPERGRALAAASAAGARLDTPAQPA